MTDQRPLATQMLDLLVVKPVQLVRQLCEQAQPSVAEGRTRVVERVKVARWVGEMAVNFGRIELERRLNPVATVPPTTTEVEPQVHHDVSSVSLSAPFEGYDQLAAAQVVTLLARLPHAELVMIRNYEEQRRARRTVLAKLDQLLSS